jgi:muramoyltetrapeptide carboxypeptidase
MTGPPLSPLVRPRRLAPGDTVAVVATSGPLLPERLRRGVALLEKWDLQVRVGAHALDADARFPFLAGTDEDRAADLEEAWLDPDVAAVLVGRGGSGAARLIDLLDWSAMRAAGPKLLVGFSDVTALHEAVATHLRLVSLFGPMPAGLALGESPPDAASADHLRRTLFEPETVQVIAAPATTCAVPGHARGVLVGGTVSVLAAAVGTAESRPADGAIVVLEDIGEAPFRLDSLLTQLTRTGWFDGARGVVLGSWTGCGDGAAELVAARLCHLEVPVLAGLPFGHCTPALTIPLGVDASLDAAAGTLTMLRAALS